MAATLNFLSPNYTHDPNHFSYPSSYPRFVRRRRPFSGCAAQVVKEEHLKQKTAFALGLDQNAF
jgi:hypothetical protein